VWLIDPVVVLCATEAVNDPLAAPDRLSMLAFLHVLKKCNVPHPDIPMSAFDRVFVEVNWTADPSVRRCCAVQTARSSLGLVYGA
jgi:hypothetical protein